MDLIARNPRPPLPRCLRHLRAERWFVSYGNVPTRTTSPRPRNIRRRLQPSCDRRLALGRVQVTRNERETSFPSILESNFRDHDTQWDPVR